MKNVMSIIMISLFINCSAHDTVEKHNEFLSLNNTDLANLDSLNVMLFRNKDKSIPISKRR